MTPRPVLLCIGGNDSSGLAGLAADQRAAHALGVHCASVVTATTAQGRAGLQAINACTPEALQSQLAAATSLNPMAMKIGLVPNSAQLQVLTEFARGFDGPVVLDPVMGSSAGGAFWDEHMLAQALDTLVPLTTILTPNLPELARLCGAPIHDRASRRRACHSLHERGTPWVLSKGGHGDEPGLDLLSENTESQQAHWLRLPQLDNCHSRGSGCAMATSVAAALALGYSIKDAVVIAKMAIHEGLQHGYALADQSGPVAIPGFPRSGSALPSWHSGPEPLAARAAFPDCNTPSLGLYPVVDRSAWLARLLPLGVSTIQLRIKDLSGDELIQELREGISLARRYGARLFVNDYWELAIELGAYGVHLGQEDLDEADIDALHQAGLRLGTSTHCHYEVARAHSLRPSYIAIGPVYPTTSKDMPWVPHGLDGFRYWRDVLDYPLVAIGGINEARLDAVARLGAEGVAMISAITQAASPEDSTRAMIARLSSITGR